jgi:asparagine synthase (glutamine-hydrolysing)
MCGVAGIINTDNGPLSDAGIIRGMSDSMTHRGPDDSGVFMDDRVAFGHRRLKVIDLTEAARQPMSDAAGRAVIVFNGEIYNHLDLREGLSAKGHAFRSRSDTEVILNSYLEYGIGCVERLVGMFAFAVYDRRDGRVFLARDRLGVKPLYYASFDGRLIFASEIKGILRYPGFKRSPDLAGVSSYLSCRYPVGNGTMFEGISMLPAGHCMEVVGRSATTRKYWDLPIIERKEDLGEDYYVSRLRELVAESVGRRMASDVPIGAYLSGGLDSSIVVALMSRLGNAPVSTFTIGFEEDGFNEFQFAGLVSRMYGTDHREMVLTAEDYIAAMPGLIRHKDAPLGVANEPALYVMSREIKRRATVVLSGEGADEFFGGYGRIFRSPFDYERMRELQRNGVPAGDAFIAAMSENLGKRYGGMVFKDELEHFLHLYQYMGWEEKTRFLSEGLIERLDNDVSLKEAFRREFDRTKGLDIYDRYMWVFEKFHLAGLLQRVDATTMAASVEARVPFVDHHALVEFAMSIPFKYKIRWKSLLDELAASVHCSDRISERYDIPKYILKKAFEGDLPPEVVWRRKMGFPVPVHRWLGGEFNAFAREILLDDRARKRGVYNHASLEEALDDREAFNDHGFGLKTWMLLNLELWFRECMD